MSDIDSDLDAPCGLHERNRDKPWRYEAKVDVLCTLLELRPVQAEVSDRLQLVLGI
jgi:hypothetical protein